MFVLLPKEVNGKPLNLKNFGELVKKYFPKNKEGYRYFPPFAKIHDKSLDNSRWVYMTKCHLPGSKGKTNSEQHAIVAEFATKANIPYAVPPALGAAVVCLTAYINSGGQTRLFRYAMTRCQEGDEDARVIVGEFSPAGLDVNYDYSDCDFIGVAGFAEVLRSSVLGELGPC